MRELPQWEFDIYALSLPRGHGFGKTVPVGAWLTEDGNTCGIITASEKIGFFNYLIIRRRIDLVWTIIATKKEITTKKEALIEIKNFMCEGNELEPIPSGKIKRSSLFDLQGRNPSDIFNLLRRYDHQPAAWALNQLYLALPNPDKNWASDCQTNNFHTRLWEALLLASFREQGLLVSQPYESPDFHISNRLGGEAWVEAVTSNSSIPYNHVNAPLEKIPTNNEEIFFGKAAVRFAKTIGNKLSRNYHELKHVREKPFILAIADFQSAGSMIWSRNSLIGYLYGVGARAKAEKGLKYAATFTSKSLLGRSKFPAGLFTNKLHSELSAIIFSNACSMTKLNRVLVSASCAPNGLRYTRVGKFFDRTPGATDGIPFCLDITSDAYRSLWPIGYEPWSAEMEVFHNPYAKHPLPLELLPEATHWFGDVGNIKCRSYYKTSILFSCTKIQNNTEPPLTLENFKFL